jgi:hypothetical protein
MTRATGGYATDPNTLRLEYIGFVLPSHVVERMKGGGMGKKLTASEIKQIIDGEIKWRKEHPEEAPRPDYAAGFIKGLEQVKYLIDAASAALREVESR